MSSSLLAMGVFTLVGAITPGPVNVLALRHGAARSRLVSAAYVLGASASYAAVVWVMGQGAQWLLQTLPQLSTAAQWLCAAYLLWLAWRLANAPVGQAGAQQQAGSQRTLQAAGGELAHVTQVLIYMTDVADMPAIDAVYREFFEAPYPNRSSMGISALVVPGMKLEIVAYAMLP